MKVVYASLIALALVSVLAGLALQAGVSPVAVEAADGVDPVVRQLPGSTLVVVQLDGLVRRWQQIRAVPAISRLQDHLLAGSGIGADDLPRLAGDRAVIAWIPGDAPWSIVPVALLRPDDPERAVELLRSTVLPHAIREGIVWVAPPGRQLWLQSLVEAGERAPGDFPALAPVAGRLPEDGLVRAWVQAEAIAGFLRGQAPGSLPAPLDWFAASAAAELDTVRFAGFRRDIVGRRVITEMVVEYDLAALPPEVARVLDPAASPPPMPESLPPGTALMVGFRTEAGACIPWLRHVAAQDRNGALRNLEFWLEEFHERSGRDLETDLLGALGEHGWFLVLEGDASAPARAVAIFEAGETGDLEKTLLAFSGWLGENAAARTLGILSPRPVRGNLDGRTVHRVLLETPAGDLEGPAFMVAGGYLLIGTGTGALRGGLRVLDGRSQWVESGEAGHAAIRIDAPTLSRCIREVAGEIPEEDTRALLPAVADLLEDVESASASMAYEGDSIRIRGSIRFR